MFGYFYIYISIYSKLIELCLVTFIYIFYGDYGLGTKLLDLIFKDVVNKLPMDLRRDW